MKAVHSAMELRSICDMKHMNNVLHDESRAKNRDLHSECPKRTFVHGIHPLLIRLIPGRKMSIACIVILERYFDTCGDTQVQLQIYSSRDASTFYASLETVCFLRNQGFDVLTSVLKKTTLTSVLKIVCFCTEDARVFAL